MHVYTTSVCVLYCVSQKNILRRTLQHFLGIGISIYKSLLNLVIISPSAKLLDVLDITLAQHMYLWSFFSTVTYCKSNGFSKLGNHFSAQNGMHGFFYICLSKINVNKFQKKNKDNSRK